MSSTAPLVALARPQWTVLWRRPWLWIALGSLLLFMQANFWLGVAWDDDFDPTRLEAVFSIVSDGQAYLAAIFAAALMSCIQRTGYGDHLVSFLLPAPTGRSLAYR